MKQWIEEWWFSLAVVLLICLIGFKMVSAYRKDVGENSARLVSMSYDPNDVRVFLDMSGADIDQFFVSKSLRTQYSKWAKGEISIDGNVVKARKSADVAAGLAAGAMAMSAMRSK